MSSQAAVSNLQASPPCARRTPDVSATCRHFPRMRKLRATAAQFRGEKEMMRAARKRRWQCWNTRTLGEGERGRKTVDRKFCVSSREWRRESQPTDFSVRVRDITSDYISHDEWESEKDRCFSQNGVQYLLYYWSRRRELSMRRSDGLKEKLFIFTTWENGTYWESRSLLCVLFLSLRTYILLEDINLPFPCSTKTFAPI